MTKFPRRLPYFTAVLCLTAFSAIAPADCFAEWTALGPFGGGVHVLASIPEHGTLIAGTRNAQLYMSSNGAESWHQLAFPRSLVSTLNTLVVDHCTPEIMYAGISDSGEAAGLYKTEDSGKSWTQVDGLIGESVTAIADAPSVCGTLAVGTMSGVMFTPDRGTTWFRISPEDHPGLRPVVSLAFEPGSTSIIYAGTPHLPWKTSNRGRTWTSIHVGIADDSDIFSIAANGRRVLIGACSGVYRSANAGGQWQKVLGIPGTSQRTYVVKPDPVNDSIIYVGTSMGLWKSEDSGVTWTRKSSSPIRSVAIDPANHRQVFLASDDGILKSQDGANTLIPSNLGFTNRKLEAFEDAGTTLLTSSAYDVGAASMFVSSDSGADWRLPADGPAPGEQILMFTNNAKNVFAASRHRVYRSSRLGKTWTPLSKVFEGSITALEAVPQTQLLLLSTTDGLFLSKDEGGTWLALAPPSRSGIRSLRIGADDQRWAFLSDDGFFLSRDRGTTWTRVQTPEQSGPVHDFALQGTDGVLIGTLRGLAYSTDGGSHWSFPSKGLSAGTVESVLWHPYQESLMYAVQNGVPFASRDGGSSWEEIRTDEIGTDSILDLHWAADHSKLYAVTFARGLYVQTLSLASMAAPGSSEQ